VRLFLFSLLLIGYLATAQPSREPNYSQADRLCFATTQYRALVDDGEHAVIGGFGASQIQNYGSGYILCDNGERIRWR
jgi:hypothetical protein